MSPAFGGWGGRYVWRQPHGESRPFWTQGGDSFPGNDTSRDTVGGSDGQEHTTDQATIWRWRTAFQHDFVARLDWSVKAPGEANHNPTVVVNGRSGTEPLEIEAAVGERIVLDAAGTSDPDGNPLRSSGCTTRRRAWASRICPFARARARRLALPRGKAGFPVSCRRATSADAARDD